MSPLGIKRAVAIILILSPWIFIPSVFKDIVFIVAGIFLFISTLDLRRKAIHESHHSENENDPRRVSDRGEGMSVNQTTASA